MPTGIRPAPRPPTLKPGSPAGLPRRRVCIGVALVAIIALGERERSNAFRQDVFRSGVEIVTLPVTVTDSSGRTVPNLSPEHFTITEDGVTQSVSVLLNAPQPVALAVVVDTSASMRGDRWDAALAAVSAIGRALAPEDQWSLSVFADRVTPVSPWGAYRPEDLEGLRRHGAAGGTRLFDAVVAAQRTLATAPHRKRAILLISDGNDISTQIGGGFTADMSSLSGIDGAETRATNALRSGESMLYAFGIDWPYQARRARGPSERVDRATLTRLAAPTGGAVWIATTAADLLSAALQLTTELRQQYSLGYSPLRPPDGRYRRVKVQVADPALRVRHRIGYVAARP